jgi:hypothetical protein
MDEAAIIEVLGYAQGQLLPVRVALSDGTEITGIPGTVDIHPAAREVFLHPAGDDETEIGISLADIVSAELV